MRWTTALFLGAILAVLVAGVGIALQTRAVILIGASEISQVEGERWPSPFERPITVVVGDGVPVAVEDGDQDLWYAASGAVFFLTLASLPMLWSRERRRLGRS